MQPLSLSASWTRSSARAVIRVVLMRRSAAKQVFPLIIPLPTFIQTPILPIPEEIELDLCGSSRTVAHRHSDPQITPDMLSSAYCELHLRQQVPIHFCVVHQI